MVFKGFFCIILCCFSNWSYQKRLIFVLQRDEHEDWMSSLWTNTLELHQQDFRATNAIDWKECFPHKTIETYIILRLMSYCLNIHLNYISSTKLLTTMVLHGCLDGIRTVPSKEKQCLLQRICLVRRHYIQLAHLLKACIHYFLPIFYFSPNDSPSKTMKNAFYFI